jgi:glutathione peroxidase
MVMHPTLSRRHFVAGTGALMASIAADRAFAGLAQPVWHHVLPGLDGNPIELSRFRGKVLLVVNTASKCAYTPQYEGLEAIWRQYGPRGLVLIGVPSNDFGGQEPGSAKEIIGFCTGTYAISFPMAAKQAVTGGSAVPLYRDFETVLGRDGVPQWNFHKVLVGRDGQPRAGFASQIRPQDARLTLAVEAALGKTP